MAIYSLTKSKGRYIILNEGRLEEISIKTQIKVKDQDFETISEIFLSPGEFTPIVFGPLDQEYKILINDTEAIYIKNYINLQTSIIEGILNYVCDCNCGCNCENDNNSLCNLLMLRAKIDVYKRVMSPQGTAFFNAVNKYTLKLIEKGIYCAVSEEIIVGESSCNEKIIKQMILLDYLGMYFSEITGVTEQVEKDFINNKYKTKTIFCCIENLGIDIDAIQNPINNNTMGIFTINNAAYINLPPSVVGNYTLDTPNRVTYILTVPMFTTATIPAYADPEGDAAKEIRIDTLPQVGELKFDAILVTPGQIIPLSAVAAGLLGYSAPDQDGANSATFTFSISDEGSGQFTN